jgi:release factor glutamine methyltransferase
MKKRFIRWITRPWQVAIRWHLRKSRSYTFRGVKVTVMPGVFHPGFFYSTDFLLDFLSRYDLAGRRLLELGCGSGIISVMTAKMGAVVTATDINAMAVDNALTNATHNQASIQVIHSDLFHSIPVEAYDWIVVNPPYYPADPHDDAAYAWYCGRNHEYFLRFFSSLARYITDRSKTLMVLSDVCDLPLIFSIAGDHGFHFEKIEERGVWIDGKNYLYWVKMK